MPNAINAGNKKRRAFVAPLFIAGYGGRYVAIETDGNQELEMLDLDL